MTAANLILLPVSWVYGRIMAARNFHYDHNRRATKRAGIPVISVGNLTAGGTGKTPLVIEIVKLLLANGRHPAILTRGYAARTGETPDEVLEFRDSIPTVPVVINPDRIAGAAEAQGRHAADCAVLDDGFQHRRLARDLDIVVIDALNPWGGGMLLPAGRLREAPPGLRRAHAVVISRSNQVSPEGLAGLRRRIEQLAQGVPVMESVIEAVGCSGRESSNSGMQQLRGRRVLPVCGIGNPETFLGLLRECAVELCPVVTFADHHRYQMTDVTKILKVVGENRAQIVVTTRKDWVKLGSLWPADAQAPLLRLDIRTRMRDETALDALLKLRISK